MRFKIGDKVKVLNGDEVLKFGDIGFIKSVDNNENTDLPYMVSNSECYSWFSEADLELIEHTEYTPQLSDKSKFTYEYVEDLLSKEISLGNGFYITSNFGINNIYYSNDDKIFLDNDFDNNFDNKDSTTFSLGKAKELITFLQNLIEYFEAFDKRPDFEPTREEILENLSKLSDEELRKIYKNRK